MSLIGRLFVVFFAFLAACLVAGMIVVGAVLYPEFSDLGSGTIDQDAINVILGFGFIFLSGFALLPALIVVLITEAFYVRSVLAYAIGGAIVGAACYLGLIPFDPQTMQFDGIVRRHLEIMTGAGIVAGLIYWMIAGRSARCCILSSAISAWPIDQTPSTSCSASASSFCPASRCCRR